MIIYRRQIRPQSSARDFPAAVRVLPTATLLKYLKHTRLYYNINLLPNNNNILLRAYLIKSLFYRQ